MSTTRTRLNNFNPEESWQVEINIVHHCNLNCYGCNHFAPIAEPFYISLEEIYNTFNHIAKYLPNLRRVMLLGGEPLLHPKLYEICCCIHDLLHDVNIDIFTNGKLLLDKPADFYRPFKEQKATFFLTIYPYIDYTPVLAPLKEVYGDQILSRFIYRYHWTFNSTAVSQHPHDFVEQFYNCTAQALPCTSIRDYKIFECPFATMVDVYNKRFNRNIPLTGLDSISLFDVKDLSTLRDFLIKPKPICGYCKCGRGMFLWRESDRSFDEYSFTPDELIQKDPSLYNKFYGNKELLDYSATHTLFKGRRLIDMNDCHFV